MGYSEVNIIPRTSNYIPEVDRTQVGIYVYIIINTEYIMVLSKIFFYVLQDGRKHGQRMLHRDYIFK